MKIIAKLFIVAALLTVSACTSDMPELKSPCVGAENSPCDRRNVSSNAA